MNIIIGISIFIIGYLSAYIFYKQKTSKRVEQLTKKIKALEKEDYRINIKQDMFSQLEDDIYKLFLKIVSERENTEKLYQRQAKNLEDIAHQIKTPITAMLFKLENADENTEYKNGLKKQINRLNDLTGILLKLSSLEANISKMKKETVNLDELVDYALDILKVNE